MGYKSKEEHAEYMRVWIARRRENYLKDKSCAVCGATNDLEIDHIDPSQKISHRIWSWAEPRRLEELSKCQVLCKNHHLEKTIRDAAQNRKHGRTMYGYGCRCEICFEAQRKHNKQRYTSQ